MSNIPFGDLFRLVAKVYLAVMILSICIAGIACIVWAMVQMFMLEPGPTALLVVVLLGIPITVLALQKWT